MKNFFKNRNPKLIHEQILSLKTLIKFFKKEFNIYAYICYGTLLGAVRDGDVISHDSDYDIAYLSKGKTINEVRNELQTICKVLRDKKMLGKIFQNGKGVIPSHKTKFEKLHGQMHVKTPDNKLYIDVFTSWIIDNKYYLCPHIQGELLGSDIVPFTANKLNNIELVSPKNSKKLFDVIYGEDWKIPQLKKSKKFRKWLFSYE